MAAPTARELSFIPAMSLVKDFGRRVTHINSFSSDPANRGRYILDLNVDRIRVPGAANKLVHTIQYGETTYILRTGPTP